MGKILVFVLIHLFLYPQGFLIGQSDSQIRSNPKEQHNNYTVQRNPLIALRLPDFGFEYNLEKLDKSTPMELTYNEEVQYYIDLFLGERRGDLELSLRRATVYFSVIEEMLDRYNLPLELKYIAVIESGLNPLARSKSGAVGLWQFLYNTGLMFDLRVDSYMDERRDIYKSTEAACRYFQYLYKTFNDWNLVMAGYNGGPGEVRKAIARSGNKTDYWEIRPWLSTQAKNYVPAFIAMNYLMNYYYLYEIDFDESAFQHQNTDTIHLNYALSFEQISSVIDIPVSTLENLNPVYKSNYIPDLKEACTLVLPGKAMEEFLRFERIITGHHIPSKDYNQLLAEAGSKENRKRITHVVEEGEYFHAIAIDYNCTIENIIAWNNLKDYTLYPGQILEIWIPENTSD